MRSERSGAWRRLLAIAAAYVAFLLFAQFGFLAQVRRDLPGIGPARAVLAAMGIAGLAASLGTAWLLGRVPARTLVRAGLAAVAATAAASLACHDLPRLLAAAAAVGASLGLLTVAVATALPEIAPPGSTGLAAGVATGAAYLVSNLPVLFDSGPRVRALFPAALALVALAFPPRLRPAAAAIDPAGPRGGWAEPAGLVRLLAVFLVLIWLDSAAFAIVQASPGLKAATWGSGGQKLLQGGVHFAAAVVAGALLDAGLGLAVPLGAWVLFAVAFPLLQHGGASAAAAGPLYAAGISLYSVALVVVPSWQGSGASPPPRWRAGMLYGVAGWLGSALGVGMAQDQGRIPAWFLLATGAALAAVLHPRPRVATAALARLYGPALGAGAVIAAVSILAGGPAGARIARNDMAADAAGRAAAVARGRRVYVAEGCIHCHSQYVRPGTYDEAWWGPSRPLDRRERPPLVGARRQGPDLREVGNRRGDAWQELHLRDPRLLVPGSRMPSYAYLFAGNGRRGRDLVAYLGSLGEDTAVKRWEISAREPLPPASPEPARGAHLFAEYCAVCHGAQGRGDGPLAARLSDPYLDLRKPGFHSLPAGLPAGGAAEARALARIVRHGLPPTAMPGHEWLTPRQVADLAAYVQDLPARPPAGAASPRGASQTAMPRDEPR